ncbi:MAG: HEAT repeat domain-containing protein [Phycisphaerae bacterium]|nr:HEAT repeat domain-containing protein [Phycisphaerae bacterium]
MKTIHLAGVILVGLSAIPGAHAQTGESLVAQLTGRAQGPVRDSAQWAMAYREAVDYLLPLMSAEDVGSRYAPQILLQDMGSYAGRPGAEAERLALAQVLVQTLEKTKMENTVRNWFILQLERVGKAESVPLLAGLLSDEDRNTRDYARRALEKNPDAGATDALLKELAGAKEAGWKMGLIHALGERRASSAVKPLAQALSDSDPNVARAAARALSGIGGQDSVQTLLAVLAQPVGLVSADAAQGLIDMAGGMAAAKDTGGASRIFGLVYAWAGKTAAAPAGIQVAAATGLIVTDPDRGVSEAVALVQHENPRLRQAAIQAVRMSASPRATRALTALLPKLHGDSQVQVLGLIGDLKDTSAEAAVVQVLASEDEVVSLAAANALGQLGTESSVKSLLDAAVSGQGSTQKAAQGCLAVMSSPHADALVKARAASGDARARAVAIEVLGQRRPEGTAPLLLAYAADADETVRAAAFRAMVHGADAIDLAALADLLVKAGGHGDLTAPVTALKAVLAKAPDKEAAGRTVIDRMNKAQGQARLALLGCLPSVGGTTALQAVTEAVASPDEAVRDAGIRALTEWPDYEAVPALIDIASDAQASLNHYVLAVRGALRLIAPQQSMGRGLRQMGGARTGRGMGQPRDAADVESRSALCVRILDRARRIEEKRLAVAALATLPCEQSVNRLLELVQDESLKNEAALAAVSLAGAMLRTDRQAGQALAQRILDLNVSADVNSQANAVMSGRGMRGMPGMGRMRPTRGGQRAQ